MESRHLIVLLTLMMTGCGISPDVRQGFDRYRDSVRIVGRAYLHDLQRGNDAFLAHRLKSKLIKDPSEAGIDKALDQDAQLRDIHRKNYARIRDTLWAMELYATDLEVVLSRLERQREASDDLAAKAKELGKTIIKSGGTP